MVTGIFAVNTVFEGAGRPGLGAMANIALQISTQMALRFRRGSASGAMTTVTLAGGCAIMHPLGIEEGRCSMAGPTI